MGTTIKSEGQTSSGATATPEERELNKAQLAQFQKYEPAQTKMFGEAFGLGSQLLNSFQSGTDQWKSLIGGVTSEEQQRMITEQDRYLKPQFQSQGIYDSGTAATGRLRAATDLANQNAQFNVGTLQNALNLALSGQAQIQQPALGQSSALMNQLQGLRSISGATASRTQLPYQGTNLGIFGSWGGSYCWVSSEIFGGWYAPKTCMVRYYIGNIAPNWFKNVYIKYGERIAGFIHDKKWIKIILRPVFEIFAYIGKTTLLKER